MFCCKKADLLFCPCRKDTGSVILLWIKETEKSSRGENMELFEFYKKIEEYQNQKNNILATVIVRSRMNN